MTSDSGESGNTDERTMISIRLPEKKKQEWVEHLNEESDHNTMTNLIITSVDNAISGTWVLKDKDDGDEIPEDLDDTLTEVTDRLETIEATLEETRLEDTPAGDSELEDEEIRRIASRAHTTLPIVTDAEQLKSLIRHDSPTLTVENRASITGTAQDISAVINETEHATRTGLRFLEQQKTENVKSIIHEGVRRWYEKDETVDRDPPSMLEVEDSSGVDKDDLELKPGTEFEAQDENNEQ